MLKPLTLSLSLVVALSLSSVSMAGLLHGGGGCLASPQGSPQCATASPQCGSPCGETCAPKKKCCLFSGGGFKMPSLCKPKCYTYTWVLKKKRVHGCGGSSACGASTCGGVYPSGQGGYASPQGGGYPVGYPSGQGGYSAPSTYGAAQAGLSAAPTAAIAAAPAGDEAPPAPEVAPTAPAAPAANGPQSGLLFTTPSGN